MWCSTPRGGKDGSATFAIAAVLAAVSSWIQDPTALDQATNTTSSAAMQSFAGDDATSMFGSAGNMQDQGEEQCENKIVSSDWRWHCGTEIIIWTGVKPEDLFAIAALFSQADLMMQNLHCLDSEYPIKAIIGGGSQDVDLSTPILERYLIDLSAAGLMPPNSWFSIFSQVYAGPRVHDGTWDRDLDALAAWTQADLRSLPEGWAETHGGLSALESSIEASFDGLLDDTIDLLASQKAPIFIALRPIIEYAVLWTEAVRLSNADAFQCTDEYNIHRFASWENVIQQRHENSATLVKAAMEAFKRSRIISTVQELVELGEFFDEHILKDSIEDRELHVSNLQQSFVTFPRQALLLNTYNEDGTDREWGRDFLFTALSRKIVFDRLRAVPRATTHLLKYIALWNAPEARGYVENIKDLLGDDGPSKQVSVERFDGLVTQSSILSTEIVEGTVDDAGISTWKEDVQALRRSIESFISRSTGNNRHNRIGMSVWGKRLMKRFNRWAHWAPHQASFVSAPNLLIPFFIGPRQWQIRDHAVQITFDGGNREDGQRWFTTNAHQSTVWLAQAPNFRDRSQAEEREAQIRRDVEELYCEAFNPNFNLGSGD